MRGTISVLIFILVLAAGTGCTIPYTQPTEVPPLPDTAPYTQPSGPYVVLDRPDTVYYLIDYHIYFVPDIRDAVFFVEGTWYLLYGDRWYRGRSYDGPWVYIGRGDLPPGLDRLPRDYRSNRYRKERVPYGHWDKERERARPRPPKVKMERPGYLYFMAAFGVYYVPSNKYEIFYFEGGWYTRHRDTWFTGDSYLGPWAEAGPRDLPPNLRKLPGDYQSNRYRKERVPYGHWDQERERARPRPPKVRIQKPEHLYLLVRYGVYYVPDKQNEIFYAEGSWYTRHRDTWFEGDSYRGPWSQADPRSLPNGLRKLPGDYRNRSYEARRVPYGHWDQERERERERERDRTQSPDIRIQKPEYLYLLVGYSVYYVPDKRHEIFLADGQWYTKYRGTWFAGDSYRGPWARVDPRQLPSGLRKLPDDFRSYKAKHVPYGHWEDKGKRGKDERQDKEPPDREPRKIKEPRDGRKLPPGAKEPPLPEPRDEARSDRRPEKKEQTPSKKRGDGRDDKIARPKVLRYLEKLDIYFIPGIAEEILHFKDTWYLRDKGKWFISNSYNGPWSQVDKRKVPKRIITLPQNYRTDKYPSQEVPYGHWEDKEKRGKRKKQPK